MEEEKGRFRRKPVRICIVVWLLLAMVLTTGLVVGISLWQEGSKNTDPRYFYLNSASSFSLSSNDLSSSSL